MDACGPETREALGATELEAMVSEFESGVWKRAGGGSWVARLRALGRRQVTADILRHADVGKRVRALGKCAEADVAAAAKAVIQEWKIQLLNE